jgi:3-phenylpropionate/trans-cinnamate dioxygenase ferredoxin reductase subunit
MPPRIVVVGASLAGLRTVQGLRRRGSEASVTLIGAESELPYDRPPLSKDLLTGKSEGSRLIEQDALDALDVHPLLGTRAVDLDLDARRVGLHGGGSVPFDVLVIATGSAPRTLPGLNPRPGVHQLRTLEDARAIRAAFERGEQVAVIGGGFIGAEIASSARAIGLDVTIIDPLPALMTRGLGHELGSVFNGIHRDNGVSLRLGASVSEIADDGSVVLADGSVVPAGVVVVGVGTQPATGWLDGSGLELADGVVCDEFLRATGAEDVYAVGDVARWFNPLYGEAMRTEHWTTAGEQANAVASTITGTPMACSVLPYVWSDQFGRRLQIFGHVRPQDELAFVHGGPSDASFVATSTDADGVLRAAVGVSATKQLLPYRRLLLESYAS